MLKMISIFSFVLNINFVFTAQALPLNSLRSSIGPQTINIPFSFTANYNFEGIVGLDNCSGSIVRLENSKESDLALVFTNGHCLETGFQAPGTFVANKKSRRRFSVKDPVGQTLGSVNASEIVYSTMTRTDLAIYKLTLTYAEIYNQYNVRPLTLSSTRPSEQSPIEVISGYWKRGYNCAIEKFIPRLKEGNWTWDDSIRYTRPGCEVIGGTSGSPIIAAGTRTMIGINNTGNSNGERCSVNNPCEVDQAGNITAVRGYSYGEQTYWVYSCLNNNGDFDLNTPNCKLLH